MAHNAIKTSHYEIFDYWKDKSILRNGKVVTTAVAQRSELPIEVVSDWAEPECWGCGRWYQVDLVTSEANGDIYKKVWSGKMHGGTLHRCHIVPESLGGADSPENLFLLCPKCHDKAPDTINRDAFMRWVWKQRVTCVMGVENPAESMMRVVEEVNIRGGATFEEIANTLHDKVEWFSDPSVFAEKAFEFAGSKMSIHWGKRGGEVSLSSMIVVFADFLEHEYNKYKNAVI